MSKKILFFAIAILAVIAAIIVIVYLNDEDPVPPAETDDGNGLSYSLSDDGTYYTAVGIGECTDVNVTIPATYSGLPVKAVAGNVSPYGVSSWGESIKTVTLENGIERIEDNAFSNCTSLVSITIPDSVKYIGSEAFLKCRALSSVTIPDSVTTLGASAFSECTRLSYVKLGCGIRTLNYNTFHDCYSLSTLEIPRGVTKINLDAFWFCTGLVSITIPDTVTEIEGSNIHECYKLVEIVNNSSVDMQHLAVDVHPGVSRLESDGKFLFYNLEGTNYLVAYTGSESEIYLPEKFNDMPYSIYICAFLHSTATKMHIPDSIITIGDGAFSNLMDLEEIYFSGSRDDWSRIVIGDRNEKLNSVIINFAE